MMILKASDYMNEADAKRMAEHNGSFLVVAEQANSLNVWAESRDRR